MSTLWHDATKRLPDADTDVIVACLDGDVLPASHDGERWLDCTRYPFPVGYVAHWTDYPAHPAPPQE